jgi:hypothetical protein
MSRPIELGDVLRSPSGQHWEAVRRTEGNLSRGVLKVMITLRSPGTRREIQRSEPHLTQSIDAGLWRQLPRGDDTLLEILEPGDS